MNRRTLLKTVMALPVTAPLATASPGALSATSGSGRPSALFSGLPGLDYAMGGMSPSELLCVAGPPSTGTTMLLLDLAARLCARYHQNVVFWSRHQPSAYLVSQMAIKDTTRFEFAQDTCFFNEWDQGDRDQPHVIAVSSSADSDRGYWIAETTAAEHPRGCVALIMDGFSSVPMPAKEAEIVGGRTVFSAERWPHTLMSKTDLKLAQNFAQRHQLPVVVGVTTASLVDAQAIAESLQVDTHIRRIADRLVTLHRPEVYVETDEIKPADKHLVHLSGTSPQWWDTRCSRLRFDPRRLGFSTIL